MLKVNSRIVKDKEYLTLSDIADAISNVLVPNTDFIDPTNITQDVVTYRYVYDEDDDYEELYQLHLAQTEGLLYE
jgi:hypothetical protein